MTIEDWLTAASADADRRGLPGLRPLLESLAGAASDLRAVGWDDLLQPGGSETAGGAADAASGQDRGRDGRAGGASSEAGR